MSRPSPLAALPCCSCTRAVNHTHTTSPPLPSNSRSHKHARRAPLASALALLRQPAALRSVSLESLRRLCLARRDSREDVPRTRRSSIQTPRSSLVSESSWLASTLAADRPLAAERTLEASADRLLVDGVLLEATLPPTAAESVARLHADVKTELPRSLRWRARFHACCTASCSIPSSFTPTLSTKRCGANVTDM